MSFEGFSDNEIKKINNGKARKVEVSVVKNIPCHTKTKKSDVVMVMKDENENCPKIVEEIEIIPTKVQNGNENAPTPTTFPLNGHETKFNDDKSSSRLQDIELNRKLLEEQNKMKREMLKDAISKNKEKTQAEAKKLEEIKAELETIDSEVSHDISILRKEIEVATLNFNNVERQYDSIEKAFLKAKQDLYQAHERKEMLTEHLYRIIEHNEDRKAKKLSELMEKVGLKLCDDSTAI